MKTVSTLSNKEWIIECMTGISIEQWELNNLYLANLLK